ncbi:MAG: hypothetical protein ACK5NK_09650 [Niabella sp.]
MKKLVFAFLFLIGTIGATFAQKKSGQKPSSQPDMNKLMEEAMKAEGMSKEEQEEMKGMMKDIMPALQEHNATVADYPEFSSNAKLVPERDEIKIAAFNKKPLTKGEVSAYATSLYNKLMTKTNAAEAALIKKIIAQSPKANDLAGASVLAMLQGHPEAALALAMKAVSASPANLNLQNNMAALLTAYGFPEQAMPLLKKLQSEMPFNTTVLNNLSYAWLSAGETDSASHYAAMVRKINPTHPDAEQVTGVVEEGRDAEKAIDNALQNSPDPFTQSIAKNKNGASSKLDFDKIRKSITSYEYFPKDWIKIPEPLSNNVKGYNEDIATKKAYLDMAEKLGEQIDAMSRQLQIELDQSVNKGEKEFVKDMSVEMIKGLSFMSKPATVVLQILLAYQQQWMQEHGDEMTKMIRWKQDLHNAKEKEIKAIEKKIDNRKKTSCEQFKAELDGLENQYMSTVNNKFRKYLIEKTEQYRQWLNMFVTWNWYITGNTKNYILIQDLAAAAHLTETYVAVVNEMEVMYEHCNPKTYDVKRTVAVPEIPNFTCPAVVSIPVGADWQQLAASAKDFNKNTTNIKKTNKPVPNTTVSFGSGNMVAQPGPAAYVKTSNGSVSPGAINEMDDLAPLSPIPVDYDLTPLPNIPDDKLAPLPDLRKAKLTKELLNKMMKADCSNVKSSKQKLKEELERMMKKVKELQAHERLEEEIEKLEKQLAEKEKAMESIKKMKEEADKMENDIAKEESINKMKKMADELEKEVQTAEAKQSIQHMKQLVDEMEAAPAILKDIQQNGIQPTIGNSMQVPGAAALPKNLFK